MNNRIDALSIEKTVREFSNCLAEAFKKFEGNEEVQRAEILKAKEILADIDRLNEAAHSLRMQVSKCQRAYYLKQIRSIVK